MKDEETKIEFVDFLTDRHIAYRYGRVSDYPFMLVPKGYKLATNGLNSDTRRFGYNYDDKINSISGAHAVVPEDVKWYGEFDQNSCNSPRWEIQDGQLVLCDGVLEDTDGWQNCFYGNNEIASISFHGVTAGKDISSTFDNIPNLKFFDGRGLDVTRYTTNLSNLFMGDTNLTDISGVSLWDTRNVSSVSSMLNGVKNLSDKSWNTIKDTWFFNHKPYDSYLIYGTPAGKRLLDCYALPSRKDPSELAIRKERNGKYAFI